MIPPTESETIVEGHKISTTARSQPLPSNDKHDAITELEQEHIDKQQEKKLERPPPAHAQYNARRFSAPVLFRDSARALRRSWEHMSHTSLFGFHKSEEEEQEQEFTGPLVTREQLMRAMNGNDSGSNRSIRRASTDTHELNSIGRERRRSNSTSVPLSSIFLRHGARSETVRHRRASDPSPYTASRNDQGISMMDKLVIGHRLNVGDKYAGPAHWVNDHLNLKVGSVVTVNGERLVRIKDADRHDYDHYMYAFAATKRMYLVLADDYDRHILGTMAREKSRK